LFDESLNSHHLWLAKDEGIELAKLFSNSSIYRVNSGVIVINTCGFKNSNVVQTLIDYTQTKGTYDGGDQGTFNQWIVDENIDMGYLPIEYNCLKRIYRHHKSLWNKVYNDLKIVHFVGTKPWDPKVNVKEPGYELVNRLWTDCYIKSKNG
jgi:lipopolysaccharide biosynthesis glycosyltransferase